MNDPKVLRAWAFYDWANSVHSLTITSAIFPIYFPIAAVMANNSKEINFFGLKMVNTALFSYTISAAFLILAILMPLLSGIADYQGTRKGFMKFFCYLGSISCMMLFFFEKGNYYIGTFGFLFSIIGWGGSMVFYNSFLPQIATPDRFDELSARGFTYGYIGSVILLLQNLSMVLMPQWYGNISGDFASRISFLSVGVWWFVFSQIPFYYLPKSNTNTKKESFWLGGWKELSHVYSEIKQNETIRSFLSSFFLFNLGAQTVMYLGALFGSEELHLPTDALIITILLIQLIAIPGAYFCAKLSLKIGNIPGLFLIVCVWILICGFAYTVKNQMNFYLLASGIGFVMGGIQSMSRATFAKLCPAGEQDTASYFSFYDVCDRLSTVLGTFVFGLIIQITGNMRNGILVLGVVFLLSLYFLFKIIRSKSSSLILG
jgi:MFS transporter, UMF1 family